MPGTINDFHVEGRRLLLHVRDPVAAAELASVQITDIVKEAAAEVFSPRFEIVIQVVD